MISSPVGVYAITQGTLESLNYVFIYVPGTLNLALELDDDCGVEIVADDEEEEEE